METAITALSPCTRRFPKCGSKIRGSSSYPCRCTGYNSGCLVAATPGVQTQGVHWLSQEVLCIMTVTVDGGLTRDVGRYLGSLRQRSAREMIP